MRTIYLAGPIAGCSYEECTVWRSEIKNHATLVERFTFLDPMAGKELLNNHDKRVGAFYDLDSPLVGPQAIFCKDNFCVRQADIILVNLESATERSIGTMFELGAAYALGKLIITIMSGKDNPHYHPFVTESGIVVRSVDEAITILLTL